MTQPLRVLLLEDRAADAELIVRELQQAGFAPHSRRVETEQDLIAALDDDFDLVLADYQLPQFDGLRALQLLRQRQLGVPFILVTGTLGEETAVDCIKQGADDYVVKDRLTRLGPAVIRALDQVRLRRAHAAALQKADAADQQMVATESRYRALFENLLNGYLRGRIVQHGDAIDYLCLEVNPAFERVTGLPSPVGKCLLALFPEVIDDDSQLLESLARAAHGAAPHRFELRFKPLGNWIDAAVYHSPPDEFIIVFDNITNRKQVEESLRQSQARLQAAVAGANIGLWDWNTETGEMFFSPEWKGQIGYADDELEASFAELENRLHPDDRERTLAALRAYVANAAGAYDVEFRLRHKGGSYRFIRARATMQLGGEGRATRMVGCHLDVTDDRRRSAEREELEAELRQSQKLEAIGQLTGGVAHDFNNLLTVILGFAMMLGESLDADDVRRKDLGQIQEAGARATLLTRQLLALSRRQVLEPKVVDLNALVSNLTRMLSRLIGEQIGLETHLAQDLGATRVDPGQIEQVITNLAVNARDAMPKGGSIVIETTTVALNEAVARAHPSAERTGRYVRLRVADTGVGMDKTVLQHIFEPFFTTKPPGKGTGLGLSTVYGIVRQSGGFMEVDSRLGHGTVFDVYLPVVAAELDATADSAPAADRHGSETILLVEDDFGVRELCRQALEQRGYRVLQADSPVAAMTVAGGFTATIDLLVTDVIMPGRTGPELYRALEPVRPGLRVLFMSGYSDDAAPLAEINGHVFLQKPFNAGQLRAKVREALERSGVATA